MLGWGKEHFLKMAKYQKYFKVKLSYFMMPSLGAGMGQRTVQLCRSIRGAQEDKGKEKMANGIDLNE